MKFLDPYFTGLGIDVSDHHVRLAQVGFFGSVIRLEEVVLPEGLVLDEHVVKPDELRAIVKDKLTSFGLTSRPYRATVLVPESRIFSHATEIPRTVPADDRKRKAREAAQREIPVPFSQARVSCAIAAREGDVLPATVYAVEKNVFDPLHAVFAQEFLHLVAMEANTKALLRLLTTMGSQPLQSVAPGYLMAIADVGHAWTTFSLYSRLGMNVFSRTIPHATKRKALPKQQGLPESAVDIIIGTIKETVLFFEQKHFSIGAVILGGVEAQDERFKKKFGQEKASLEIHLISDLVKAKGMTKNQCHAFGSAIGAALRSVRPSRYKQHYNFLET